jgi:UDP-N-acetylglucosamine acyltransferase
MVGSHVGHDCVVGNDVVFANNVVLGGHVSVGDHAVFGGNAAVRQNLRVGEGAMIAGVSGVRADVIPFACAQGPLANLVGLNVVGLRRRGVAREDIRRLRQAYQALFFGAGAFRERLESVAKDFSDHPIVARVVDFIRAGGARPLTTAVHRHGEDDAAATIS